MAITWEFVRFLAAGLANTAVAYVVYLLLVQWLQYPIAWGIGYAAGIATGYVVNTLFVFRKPMKRRSAFGFVLIYVLQYLVSVALLHIALNSLQLPHWLGALAVIAVTLPASFLSVKLVMGRG